MKSRFHKLRDIKVYALAKEFLLARISESDSGITPEILESYMQSPERPKTLSDVYFALLASAQSANMKAGVIGRSLNGGLRSLGKVLCDFNPHDIVEKYNGSAGKVLSNIRHAVKPRGRVNRAPNGIWPRYCRTILEAAKFLSQFHSANEFYEWVDWFYQDERARPALPLLLESQIYGLGFALSCDFLKEMGYAQFGKPDIHLRDIFTSLNICEKTASDQSLLSAIQRVAKNVGVSPYNVDKLFWLIASGNFYNHGIKIGQNKKDFIVFAENNLSEY